jgi:hypothetical protein
MLRRVDAEDLIEPKARNIEPPKANNDIYDA